MVNGQPCFAVDRETLFSYIYGFPTVTAVVRMCLLLPPRQWVCLNTTLWPLFEWVPQYLNGLKQWKYSALNNSWLALLFCKRLSRLRLCTVEFELRKSDTLEVWRNVCPTVTWITGSERCVGQTPQHHIHGFFLWGCVCCSISLLQWRWVRSLCAWLCSLSSLWMCWHVGWSWQPYVISLHYSDVSGPGFIDFSTSTSSSACQPFCLFWYPF